MFIAATALTGNDPLYCALVVGAVVGVLGTLLAGASAVVLAVNMKGALAPAKRMLFASCICAVTGSASIIAGTQAREVTAIAGVCVVAMLVDIAWHWIRASPTKAEDAEAAT